MRRGERSSVKVNVCDGVLFGSVVLPIVTSGSSFAFVVCKMSCDGVENMFIEAVQRPLPETFEIGQTVRDIKQLPKPFVGVLGECIT